MKINITPQTIVVHKPLSLLDRLENQLRRAKFSRLTIKKIENMKQLRQLNLHGSSLSSVATWLAPWKKRGCHYAMSSLKLKFIGTIACHGFNCL
jgi:hypothetical protein